MGVKTYVKEGFLGCFVSPLEADVERIKRCQRHCGFVWNFGDSFPNDHFKIFAQWIQVFSAKIGVSYSKQRLQELQNGCSYAMIARFLKPLLDEAMSRDQELQKQSQAIEHEKRRISL